MTGFKDHFSAHAALYRQSRPRYPDTLFHWLAEQAPGRERAWDCATGNGQAALALAGHFAQVIATDASAEQIAHAERAAGVTYRVAAAERSGLGADGVDLITVAQAAHWFDLPAFYEEVRRVARAGAVLALWCYGLARISPAVDAVIDGYYHGTVGSYWPPERRHVESGYRDLPFPLTELQPPTFTMRAEWSLPQLLDYLGSWSATRRCAALSGADPLQRLAPELAAAWGEHDRRSVEWPLAIRVGRHRQSGRAS